MVVGGGFVVVVGREELEKEVVWLAGIETVVPCTITVTMCVSLAGGQVMVVRVADIANGR